MSYAVQKSPSHHQFGVSQLLNDLIAICIKKNVVLNQITAEVSGQWSVPGNISSIQRSDSVTDSPSNDSDVATTVAKLTLGYKKLSEEKQFEVLRELMPMAERGMYMDYYRLIAREWQMLKGNDETEAELQGFIQRFNSQMTVTSEQVPASVCAINENERLISIHPFLAPKTERAAGSVEFSCGAPSYVLRYLISHELVHVLLNTTVHCQAFYSIDNTLADKARAVNWLTTNGFSSI